MQARSNGARLAGFAATLASAVLLAGACSDATPTAADVDASFAKGGNGNGMAENSMGAKMYIADLMPLNNSGVTGTARFQIVGDKFQAWVHAKDLAPGKVHPQHIHAKAMCPFPQNAFDTNNDGLVDIFEGAPAYGKVLIPLDNILADQSPNMFPMANPAGILNYTEKTSLDALLMALTNGMVPNPALFTDLNGEELNLAERTVVLHGAYVKNSMVVSAGTPGAEYWETLPVACGTIDMR